jgi:hypothetical protein
LREEYRLRVFENGVLRKALEPKRDEVTGEWKRLHNEEFYGPCVTSNIILAIKSRRMRQATHVDRVGDRKGAQRVLVGKSGRKRSIERPVLKRNDNIKMDLQELGWESVD